MSIAQTQKSGGWGGGRWCGEGDGVGTLTLWGTSCDSYYLITGN